MTHGAADEWPRGASLRVLITNRSLIHRAGTELYVAELAVGLLERGHLPMVYSPRLGDVAAGLRQRSVPVVSSLAHIDTTPDIIHGHHRTEALTAITRHPSVPAVYVAHDWTHPDDVSPIHPRILRYIAVDNTNRDRLLFGDGVPSARVDVQRNWVDLGRFTPRLQPLPVRPRRALVLSNTATEGSGFLVVVREACERSGISVDVRGLGVGNVADRPEELLGSYDIVFAKARAALEAMAVGCATILCDAMGFGGLVTADEVVHLRQDNFGLRALNRPHDLGLVCAAIGSYDASDAAKVSEFVRADAGMDRAIDGLVEIYRNVIAEAKAGAGAGGVAGAIDSQGEGRAVSLFLESVSRVAEQHERHVVASHANFAQHAVQVGALSAERDELSLGIATARAAAQHAEALAVAAQAGEVAARHAESVASGRADTAEHHLSARTVHLANIEAQLATLEHDHTELLHEHVLLKHDHGALQHDHAVTVASFTFRLRSRLSRNRALIAVWRRLLRRRQR